MLAPVQRILFTLLALPVLLLGFGPAVQADTIYVCWDGSGDYLTIQEGIDAAEDGDEVVVCDGVYTGPLNKNLDFAGKLITVRSENGPDNCIIDCEGDGRGFYFHSGETAQAVVQGLTIRNGYVDDDSPGGFRGGGVYCLEYSSPTLANCTIVGNTARGGGGVCCDMYSSPTLTNCTITDNTANHNGGGVLCRDYSSPTLTNCTITGNTALDYGGGVQCYGNSGPTLTDCEITGNTARLGGGGVCCKEYSSPTLTNCTISDNTARYDGGGVFCSYSSAALTNCTIAGNTAALGGGVDCLQSSPTLTNCTIAGNTALHGGGVNCRAGSSPTLVNCTISGNTADEGGGVYCYYSSAALTNCTITGNTALDHGGGVNCYACSLTVTNCILWNDTPEEIYVSAGNGPEVSYSDVQGGWPGEGNIDADPLFGSACNSNYGLSPGSPCIDAGNNTAVPPDITTDLCGDPRFVDDPCTEPDTGNGDPPIVDMGAYEYQPCAGDLDCDGDVDLSDLAILLAAYGTCDGDPNYNPVADLDGNDCVDLADLAALLAVYGTTCP